MALIKAELIVFGTGQTVIKDGRRITIEPATLAWRINEFEGEALLVDSKFSEVLGVSTTEMPWVIAKHNTMRKTSKPTSSVTDEAWAGKDYLDYELPRWSWLRGYAHEEKFMDIHPTISGDVVFVGRVPSREMLVIMARMPAGSNAFIIGRQHTMDQWADGTQQRIDATISGVKIITIFEKVGNWLLALQDCPEFELKRVACVAFGLTKYSPSIVGSVSEFAAIARTGTSLLAVGPAEGSTTNDDEQRQIYSVPFSAGAMSSRELDWPTRSLYNTKVLVGKKRPIFKRKAVKPHLAPLAPPVGFYGMQLTEIVEEDYSDYTAQRDASTDAEWKLAMDKFAAREVYSWGKGEVTIDGKVFNPIGPNWVSRHENNWRFAYKHVGLDQRPSPINVLVIGVFEGLSVNMWNQIMGSQRGKIYTVDVGRTLEGAWGLPRCCTIEGNLPPNTVPFIGQSGVVLPLLAARLGQMGVQVDIVEIDGSHHCDDVYLDCEYAWRLLAKDGIMVLDDYGFESTPRYHPADGNYVFNATRGIHAFLWQHASEYEFVDVPDNFYQLILRKKVHSYHMLGTASIPYDMDGVWEACKKDGTFKRHVNFYRPGIQGLIGEYGSDRLWYAPAQSGQIALDALTLPLKSVASMPAAALDVGGQIATNIGGGFEQIGDAIGQGQKDNAVAGFGNMFKSFGAAAGATGSFLAWGARKTAEVWVPQEARWW